jgi:hypothetical protein
LPYFIVHPSSFPYGAFSALHTSPISVAAPHFMARIIAMYINVHDFIVNFPLCPHQKN